MHDYYILPYVLRLLSDSLKDRSHIEKLIERLSNANKYIGGEELELSGTLTPSRFGINHEVSVIVSNVIKEDYITAHRAAERLQMLLTKA